MSGLRTTSGTAGGEPCVGSGTIHGRWDASGAALRRHPGDSHGSAKPATRRSPAPKDRGDDPDVTGLRRDESGGRARVHGAGIVGWMVALAVVAFGAGASAATLRLAHGLLHPMTGPPLTNASLLIRDGKIAALETAETGVPVDETIELAGAHVYPGLIAPTTVLGLVDIDSVRASRDTTEVGEFRPDVYSWVAVHPDSDLIPVARANGYTHVQTVPMGGTVSGQSAVLTLTGWTIEDLAVRRSAGLHVRWPTFELDAAPREPAAGPEGWKPVEEQVRERERRVRRIEAFFADAEAYRAAREAGGAGFRRVPAWEAMLPVMRGEVPVVLHADEVRQIRSAVEWAKGRKLRAVLAGGRDGWQVAEFLAEHRIPVAYEDVFTEPRRDVDSYDVHFAAPGILARAGVKVSFAGGLDRFGASNLRNVPYAAAQAVAFGLPREEALRGLTLYPAEMLGMADRLGSLAPGKDATLIVASGDILDLRSRVTRMWIEGRETSLESKHTRLYDRYRSRPKAAGAP